MKDSVMYQDIYGEGRVEGRKEGRTEGRKEGRVEFLLRLGVKRWGQPNEGEKVALEAITDIERLERMFDRMVEDTPELNSWDDLLQVQ